jgi:hypothetical protein
MADNPDGPTMRPAEVADDFPDDAADAVASRTAELMGEAKPMAAVVPLRAAG